ncbi:MAG: TRAM domain-containing protein, partial [Eubacteriales bacterium]|nr:TRAM domain-containing protein [Eubacteriales bacterium]
FVKKIGFARIHVFPYSRRKGTVADRMPGQLSDALKQARAKRLIAVGNELEQAYVQATVGNEEEVLFETQSGDGLCAGYTRSYVRVRAKAQPGELKTVRILSAEGKTAGGEVL